MKNKHLEKLVIDKLDDIKATNIISLDLVGKSSITDCMIICTGTSSRHVASIADHIIQNFCLAGKKSQSVNAKKSGDWVVVDLNEIMVHIMQEDSRRLYELEKLWG